MNNDEAMSRLKTLAGQAQILAEKDTLDIDQILKTFEKTFGVLFPIDAIEKILDIYKKRLSDIVQVQMPTIMNENEITGVTLDNGLKLSLKKGITPKVIDDEKMIEWIESINQGDSIKTELKFGKGEVDENLRKYLEENGYSFEQKEGVHYQTLKKIISDRFESGEGLPPADAVSVTPYDEVIIK
jgi:hypothetical protein